MAMCPPSPPATAATAKKKGTQRLGAGLAEREEEETSLVGYGGESHGRRGRSRALIRAGKWGRLRGWWCSALA